MGELVSIEQESELLSFEEKLLNCTVIAKPIADEKTTSRIYRLVKKAFLKKKTNLRMGLKPVQSKLRKGEKGLVIIAGDVQPIDILCHMPAVCEGKDIPYIFVPSKKDLGAASGTKGTMQIVLVLKDDDFEDLYDKVQKSIKKIALQS